MRGGALAGASLLLGCSSFGATPPSEDGGASPDAGDAGVVAPVCPPGTDFTTRANCGTCGHDCGGGDCNGGTCSPYPIVTNTPAPPWYLVVDDTHVYWTSFHSDYGAPGDGSIARASKFGGGQAEVIARPKESFDLVVDGSDILYTSPNETTGVFRLAKTGGNPVALDDRPALGIVNGPNGWYVTSRSNAASGPLAAITFIPRAGAAQRLFTMVNIYNPEGIAWDGKDLYWANHNGLDPTNIGSIGRRLSGQAEQIEWSTNEPGARHLVIDEVAVYWSSDQGKIRRRLRDGGSGVVTLYAGDVKYGLFTTDKTSLFICSMIDGRVVRVPKVGGDAVPIATVVEPAGITQDDKAIYFAERGANRIWRMVK